MSQSNSLHRALIGTLRAALIASLFFALPVGAQTFTAVGIVPSTIGPIDNPAAQQVVQGRNGEIYTISGYQGGILSVTTAGAFAEVAQPFGGGLTLGTDGNFYSALYFDRIGCGDIDKTTPTGTVTFLASICGTYGNGPMSQPIEGPNGVFYGASSEIPSGQAGTIYSMTSAGTLGLLHTFAGTDGSNPIAPLVVGSDGNLYGGTRGGGSSSDGVLFKITPSGAFTVLHNFAGTDGSDLEHAMILGHDGNLYGVTQTGGSNRNGVFFKLTNSGVYTVIYNFTSSYTGPNSAVVQATDGNFYGLLGQGNASEPGWIYSLTTAGTFAILYEFCQDTGCSDGIAPSTPLVQHTDGKLYGFTVHGGDSTVCGGDGCGVLYSLDMGLAPFATLVSTSGKEGASIGILGQGFNNSTAVSFGGTAATTVHRTGSTFLSVAVPAGALTGSVTVTTGATTLTSSQKFSVKPVFTTFSPPSGAAGTAVTITGTGLKQTGKVEFNGVNAAFTVNSDTQVTATVPAGATTGRIGVTTRGGTVESSSSFTVN